MLKLLATDMDGTLLRDDKTFSEEFYDLYQQLKEQGIRFMIASGNQYDLLKTKFKSPINEELYYLCENGTKVVYKDQVLYKHAMSQEDFHSILEILKEIDNCMIVASGNQHAYISKEYEYKKDFITLFMKNIRFVDRYDDIDDEILKFSIASFDGKMEERIQTIQSQMIDHYKLVTTGNIWFDIIHEDVNKGTTIKMLQDILNLSYDECGAFGDMMNDYELLQNVKYAYAMGNAVDEIKGIAYKVIDTNENDGVLKQIKEILKGND